MANWVGKAAGNLKVAVVATVKGVTLRDPIQAWLTDSSSDVRGKHVHDPFRRALYVNAGITIIAQTVSGVPVQVLDRNDQPVETTDDESVRLLQRPNALNSWRSFIERTIILKQLDGLVYWVTSDHFDRRLERAVYVVPRRDMRPHFVGGVLAGYFWAHGGHEEPVELSRVRRIFYVDPADELGGLSRLSAAQLAIDAHTHAARHNASTFANGAEPGSVYTTDKPVTTDQREQLERRIEKRHRGSDNAGKPMILGGGLHREPPPTNADMQYIEGQKLTAQQQIAPLHLPPIYAGLIEDVNRSTAEVQEGLLWDLIVLPEIEYLLAEWNDLCQAAIDPSKRVVADLDRVPILQAREIDRTDKVLALGKYGIPLNTLIESFGLQIPPQKWGDEPLVSAGQLPISVVYDEARAAVAADNAPEGDGTDGTDDEGGETRRSQTDFEDRWKALQTAVKAGSDARTRRALHERWQASYAGLRRVARRRFRSLILRQRDEAIRRLQHIGLPRQRGEQKADYSEWVARILFDVQTEGDKITALGRYLIREGMGLGGAQAGAEADAPDDWAFRIDDAAVKRRMEKQAIRVRKVNDTTREIIRRTLLDGLDAGETLSEVSERVAKSMGRRANAQTYRIANTEMHEAVATGRHEGFRQAGVKCHAWLTSGRAVAPEGPVRPTHRAVELETAHQPIRVGELFAVGAAKCLHPGAGNLPPGERINCSCVTIPKTTAKGKAVSLAALSERGFVTYEEYTRRRGQRKD